METLIWVILVAVFAVVFFVFIPMAFRKVVETNTVHIVQSKKNTTSYGTGQESGNVYYRWPSWIPAIGVTRIVLPVNNFSQPLHAYKAYDKDRVPFELDLVAFFRISNTNIAAQRIANFEGLKEQLLAIVQGAARKILASHDINQIMVDRATFGEHFTNEVKEELKNWGVEPVKNMELMDIRDADGSNVIANIMAKKASHIEMESRTEVAKNLKSAQTAEIEAKQEVDIRDQEAQQAVGERTALKDRAVGIAQQLAQQEVKAQEAITTEKDMAVKRVSQVRQAEIMREAQVVTADQTKQTTVIEADGKLQASKLHAEGVRIEGVAKADAEQAWQLAPVNAQITLAKEIGTNPNYQSYLVSLKGVEAYTTVGSKQAEALAKAEVKVIANTGNAVAGVTNVMELFSSKGGLAVGSMLEALSNTPEGKSILDSVKLRLVPAAVGDDTAGGS